MGITDCSRIMPHQTTAVGVGVADKVRGDARYTGVFYPQIANFSTASCISKETSVASMAAYRALVKILDRIACSIESAAERVPTISHGGPTSTAISMFGWPASVLAAAPGL